MQLTGDADPFWWLGATNGFGNEKISHFVPAINLRALLSMGSHVDLLAEYIGAVKAFSFSDLTFNSHGARPTAVTFEAAYSFTLFDRPASIAAGYARSNEALAILLLKALFTLSITLPGGKTLCRVSNFATIKTMRKATRRQGAVPRLLN